MQRASVASPTVKPRDVDLSAASVYQSVRNRSQIDKFEFAAHRHAARQPGDHQAFALEDFTQSMRRGFALGGEIGGQNDFLHHAVTGSVYEFLHAYVAGPDALDGIEFAHQHKIQALVGQRSFNRGLV